MGGFRSGPLFFMVFGAAPLFLAAYPSPTLSCESLLNPLAFQITTFTQNTLLPNGMMAIRYPETEQEVSPHVSVHRVLMVIPGLQESLPEASDGHYRIVEGDGTIGWITYIVSAHALFYGVGEDSLGFPEKIWIDPEEDGLNGNEHINGREPDTRK
ncbi:MAG: hypothetical protein NPIRA06_16530 [Nitrospirales bacterium]|nr:MAG: hypothetical protein NPIRA06_16530 [Nitrospirales bacterium]